MKATLSSKQFYNLICVKAEAETRGLQFRYFHYKDLEEKPCIIQQMFNYTSVTEIVEKHGWEIFDRSVMSFDDQLDWDIFYIRPKNRLRDAIEDQKSFNPLKN